MPLDSVEVSNKPVCIVVGFTLSVDQANTIRRQPEQTFARLHDQRRDPLTTVGSRRRPVIDVAEAAALNQNPPAIDQQVVQVVGGGRPNDAPCGIPRATRLALRDPPIPAPGGFPFTRVPPSQAAGPCHG